jgi:hypothetical protein
VLGPERVEVDGRLRVAELRVGYVARRSSNFPVGVDDMAKFDFGIVELEQRRSAVVGSA